jgi:hypothetical protein
MKVRALKDFQSIILSMVEGEENDLEIESHILESWISSGLIEEVKVKRSKKSVKSDDN